VNSLPDEIKQRLASLHANKLDIQDDSAKHAGHAGNGGGGHFTITVVSSHFSGKSRIMRHQFIYQALQDLIPGRIHALSIAAYAPDEIQPHS